MDIPHLIDEYNRTKRQAGEPVMTQRRLAELAGISEGLVSHHISGARNITTETRATYARILRLEESEAA